MFPLLAMTTIEYVPAAVFDPAVTVNTDVPEVLIELTLRVSDSPLTSEIPSSVKLAVAVKFRGIMVRLNTADFPGATVKTALSTVIQKSVPRINAHAAPGLPEGFLKLELESWMVRSSTSKNQSCCHFRRRHLELGIGVESFHHVFFEVNVV